MPGVVKKIQCEVGDSVAEGTLIVTLEAMKMQNPLFAPMTGKVSRVSQLGVRSRGAKLTKSNWGGKYVSNIHVHVHVCVQAHPIQLSCICRGRGASVT